MATDGKKGQGRPTDHERFVLELEAVPDRTGVEPIQRVQLALKILWRKFHLRCTSVRRHEPEEKPPRRRKPLGRFRKKSLKNHTLKIGRGKDIVRAITEALWRAIQRGDVGLASKFAETLARHYRRIKP